MFSDRFPKGGETVFGSEFFTGFGGESENIQSVPQNMRVEGRLEDPL